VLPGYRPSPTTPRHNRRGVSKCIRQRAESSQRRRAHERQRFERISSTTWPNFTGPKADTTTKANTRNPSPFTDGRWRFLKRSIPKWPSASTTWRRCFGPVHHTRLLARHGVYRNRTGTQEKNRHFIGYILSLCFTFSRSASRDPLAKNSAKINFTVNIR
jgi:hypothetical protein